MIITVFTRDSASGISNVQFPDRIISVLRERGKEEAGEGEGGGDRGGGVHCAVYTHTLFAYMTVSSEFRCSGRNRNFYSLCIHA
jgi:hypothetical protein